MARNRCTVRRSGSGSQLLLLAASVSVALPLVGWVFLEKWWGGPAREGPIVCQPIRGRFVHEVVAMGSIECASNVEVACDVSARGFYHTTILEVVPEGTSVEPGDFLIRLDSAPLERLRVSQMIRCDSSKAALIQSENWLQTIQLLMKEYIDGLVPKAQQALGADLDRAREMLRRSERALSMTRSMYRRGFVTRMSLEADRFAFEETKLDLATAETKLDVLNSRVKRRLMDLEGKLAVAEASVKWRRHFHDLNLKELANIEEQIAKCVITSPQAGQVVYVNTHHYGHSHLIQPGEIVWRRRPLIRLPNSKDMRVYVLIREDKVAEVLPGLGVRIRLEAFPGAELTGAVERVGEFPAPNPWWSSQVKSYETTISIDRKTIEATGVDLRPGLSAEVRIQVDQRSDQLMLPLQAVLKHGQKRFCLTRDSAGLHAQEITLGDANGKYVIVSKGLAEGDRVVLGAENYRREVGLPELPPNHSDAGG